MMRWKYWLLKFMGLVLLLPISVSAQSRVDTRRYDKLEYQIHTYDYAFFLPQNYDPGKTYPVLIGPGEGIRGSDKCFYWNVDDPGRFGWILVEFPLWKQNSSVVKALLDELREKFKVEGNKFHLVGFSANAASCFGHAISNPDYFHSITVLSGHPLSKDKDQLMSLKGVKIQNIVGENDKQWLSKAREFDALFKELGLSSTLEVIEGEGHILAELVGEGFLEKVDRMR